MFIRGLKSNLALALCLLLAASWARAALFEDDEARRAILDLRQQVEQIKSDSAARASAVSGGLLDLQRQIELLRSELAVERGYNEKLAKDLADLQQRYNDDQKSLSDRLARLEPTKVTVDGLEFNATAEETRDFDAALNLLKQSDFVGAQKLFAQFVERYPASGYVPSALFWLGNAQYATRNYKEAIQNFRQLVAKSPDHVRAPEAVLSMANCQIELKDSKGARATLSDLIKAYPQSEAALAAKERLTVLQ